MNITLTELLCARLCHDLAGPIGAISNGIEFLREDKDAIHSQAFDLVESSANEMVARLKFFRQAYGVVSVDGEADISLLRDLANNLFANSKITLDWSNHYTEAANVPINHRTGRLLLNLIIIASHALILGGTIAISMQKNGSANTISVTGTGKRIKLEENLKEILSAAPNIPIDKRNVQLHYTAAQANELHTTLTLHHSDEHIQLMMHLPDRTTETNNIKNSFAIST